MTVGRLAGRTVDGTHLGARVGGYSGCLEGGGLNVVAHAPDVVGAHRFDIEQSTAVVEVELAVPAVVDGVAEIHELRRCADVELQPLKMVITSSPSYPSAFCTRLV